MPVVLVVLCLWPARIDVSLDAQTVTFRSVDEAWAQELRRLDVRLATD